MQNTNVENELSKITTLLNSGDLSESQYEQMYAAQQALTWAMNDGFAQNPVATIIQRKIIAPKKIENLSQLPSYAGTEARVS